LSKAEERRGGKCAVGVACILPVLSLSKIWANSMRERFKKWCKNSQKLLFSRPVPYELNGQQSMYLQEQLGSFER
jgi:hypothetical protein